MNPLPYRYQTLAKVTGMASQDEGSSLGSVFTLRCNLGLM